MCFKEKNDKIADRFVVSDDPFIFCEQSLPLDLYPKLSGRDEFFVYEIGIAERVYEIGITERRKS